jgi:D-lyxose ketol-isomerase
MRRSEVNAIIGDATAFFEEMNFKLPRWAFWTPKEWKGKRTECAEIIENMLGWDVTKFGGEDFDRRGLLLFTARNGNLEKDDKPYAEKIMIVREEQETPMHFHWNKMEDIINRGGGNLVIELYGSDENEKLADGPVMVSIDGIRHTVPAGGTVVLEPGDSICLEQGVYHRFYGEAGRGRVLVGEVSKVNDDTADNCFLEDLGRFPPVEEDEPPLHLLAIDYPKYV